MKSKRLLEGSREALKLLEYAGLPHEVKRPYNGVDIDKIAKDTQKKETPLVLEMIKDALREVGVVEHSPEDVNEIYLAVSYQHFKMAL